MSEITSYRAVALQTDCRTINAYSNPSEARAQIARNIERIGRQIPPTLALAGSDTRLVVLPEYVLTGFPIRETPDQWIANACLSAGCEEFEALSRIAEKNGVFLAGNGYESDTNFPELYFQTSFIIDPSGDVILRYRRINSMFAPTPHYVWDRYLEIYGLEAVFPVVSTTIGRLAAVASEEILYPEITRCLAMRGAEVIVHSTCEVASPRLTPKGIARRARAIENMVYVVSCNTAKIVGFDLPSASVDGGSMIVGPQGQVLIEAGRGESMVACAEIDLAALRRYRRRPGMANILSRQRFEAYAESYARHSHYPANTLAEGFQGKKHFTETQTAVIEKLSQSGVI